MEVAIALPGCAAAAPGAPATVSQQASIPANGVTLRAESAFLFSLAARADATRQVPAFLDALP